MSDTTTSSEPLGRADARVGLSLMVVTGSAVSTYTLPERGSVVIGRTGSADIYIDLPQVSRHHARISLGSSVTVEDLGSANGTRVRGRLIPQGGAIEIEPGDPIELGPVLLLVRRSPPVERSQRIWSHEHFEAHLHDRCARAADRETRFTLVRIRLDAPSAAVVQKVVRALAPDDAVASYSPRDIEVLLADSSTERAERVVERIRKKIGDGKASCWISTACYPIDGVTPAELLARLAGPSTGGCDRRDIVRGSAMQSLWKLVERVAAGKINVLLMGETGVGKELLADRLHRLSRRAKGPFLKLNCAALSEHLLESELFGHEKGAFTGADRSKPGLLEVARGGTVFLDEVGDLPQAAQAKLLRAIEEQKILRVGGLEPRPIDVRFVSATNRDLDTGPFRRDLFFRLAGVIVRVPPLRERVDEIGPLARGFVTEAAHALGIEPREIAPEAIALLERYAWPGNVRELRNVMERAVLVCTTRTITDEHLPLDRMASSAPAHRAVEPNREGPRTLDSQKDPTGPIDLRSGREAAERQMVLEALDRTGGNQTAAARLLRISRRALIGRIIRFDLPRPRKKQ